MYKFVDILRFGRPYLRRYWFRLTIGLLLGVIFGLSSASFVWATRTLIDRMAPEPVVENVEDIEGEAVQGTLVSSLTDRWTERGREWIDPWLPQASRPLDWHQIVGGLLFLPLLVAFRGLIGFLSKYCLAWVGERAVNDMRNDVLSKLNSLSLDYFNRSTMGDMITHVNTDTATIQKCLRSGISDLIEQPMIVVGVLVAMCWIDVRLTLAAMLFFPLCAVPVFILGKKARKAGRRAREVTVTQSSLLYEILLGIRVVKAFGLEEQQENRFRKQSRQLVNQAMKARTAKELVAPIIETVAMVGFGLLIVYVVHNNRPVADMVGFLTGLAFFYNPIKKLAGIHVLLEQTSISVDRMMHLLAEQPSVKEPARPRPLREFKSEIVFERVNFSYGSELVLRDFNLRIPKGHRLGIAGESGSGKSTLVNLLFRFFDPTSGRISIDGIDLCEIAGVDIRRLMAMVSQDVMLFDLSVAENIAHGKPGEATRAEVEAAARAAFAHEFIAALPEGYDTRIGERGVTLSGGQRQRLCIARAFIRDAPILVLDEATASLDSQSEAEVQAAIDRLAENRTVVSVAHRLSTLAQMDEIIVLSRGRLIEQGTFAELLRNDGSFAAMARRQGIFPEGMAVK